MSEVHYVWQSLQNVVDGGWTSYCCIFYKGTWNALLFMNGMQVIYIYKHFYIYIYIYIGRFY